MAVKKTWTDAQIKGLKPELKRYEKYIIKGGLGIRVTPAGVKTWIYRYKIDGKTEKLTIGHYPTMTLANANMRFLELSDQRRDGLNPKELIQAEEADKERQKNNTVKKLVLDWYSQKIDGKSKRPLTIKKQIDGDIIPLLGDKELDTLQTVDITKALDAIVARGAPIHANRVLSSLKQVFNSAVSRGGMQHNPAACIRAKDIGGTEKPRERYLSLDEIKTLWQFLDGDKNQMALQTKCAIKIILLTGVRTAELRLATFDEFDFEQSLWTIPAEHSKTDSVMKIHLSSQVKALLMEIKTANNSQHVLSGIKANTPLTENALPRAIKRIEERLGIPSWTAHDLRRTFATQLGEALHLDPVVIEKCLGHKMPRIMATYNKNEMLPQRKEALDRWAQFVEDLLQENVIPISLKKCS
jgi:integrase